ncbi:G-protein coupled receptor 52-like [Lytechinus variegatus]|uniref:G-protein coupled receptor 52-like n=1 Tax=Lytechinus variegatus TaxID=7654 RepID=UPI001BB14F80|nr:G-protein coupled receptor 52-like [Lytechinus variegatus]
MEDTNLTSSDFNVTGNGSQPGYQYVISTSQVSFLVVMAIVIIACNLTVLLVHHLTPALHVPISVFIKSLAYADLWVGVNCALNIGVTFARGWPYGLLTCKLIGYLLLVVVLVSITTLTCIGIERYTAIQNPINYRSFVTYKRARICVILIWVLCGLVFLPAFFNWGMDVDIHGSCPLFWRYNISFGFFLISILIIPNLLISIICYIRIIHTLVARQRWLQTTGSTFNGPQQQNACQKQHEKLMAKIGLAIMSAFYITWLPYVASSFIRYLDLANIPQDLYNGTLYLGISNSFLNCVIYSISHQAFRDGFKNLVKRCCCSKQTKSYESGSPGWSRKTTGSNSPSTIHDTSIRIQKLDKNQIESQPLKMTNH